MSGDDRLRERLAEVLPQVLGPLRQIDVQFDDIYDALLPLVREYADQRAAEELRKAADHISRGPETWAGARYLQARAAALGAAREQRP